ncbi:unnamed protein product [Somion occarium]|uniref:Uncharacterized protein n=1 Tax=Somion occarium TaxID=3059160 RepID=A0ABP1CN60_9APHY
MSNTASTTTAVGHRLHTVHVIQNARLQRESEIVRKAYTASTTALVLNPCTTLNAAVQDVMNFGDQRLGSGVRDRLLHSLWDAYLCSQDIEAAFSESHSNTVLCQIIIYTGDAEEVNLTSVDDVVMTEMYSRLLKNDTNGKLMFKLNVICLGSQSPEKLMGVALRKTDLRTDPLLYFLERTLAGTTRVFELATMVNSNGTYTLPLKYTLASSKLPTYAVPSRYSQDLVTNSFPTVGSSLPLNCAHALQFYTPPVDSSAIFAGRVKEWQLSRNLYRVPRTIFQNWHTSPEGKATTLLQIWSNSIPPVPQNGFSTTACPVTPIPVQHELPTAPPHPNWPQLKFTDIVTPEAEARRRDHTSAGKKRKCEQDQNEEAAGQKAKRRRTNKHAETTPPTSAPIVEAGTRSKKPIPKRQPTMELPRDADKQSVNDTGVSLHYPYMPDFMFGPQNAAPA